MHNFNKLINKILFEGEVMQSPDETVSVTAYDVAALIVKRMMEDPRELLPAVDVRKFIVNDPKESGAVKFNWRYGSDVFVEIKVTPDTVFIYDIKQDKVLFSTPTTDTPEHDIQNTIMSEIDKLVKQDKQEGELGVTQPMDIGTTTSSEMPDAKKPKNKETVDRYLRGSTLGNR